MDPEKLGDISPYLPFVGTLARIRSTMRMFSCLYPRNTIELWSMARPAAIPITPTCDSEL